MYKYIQQRKAEKSKKPKDVFVKQYYEPGEECEFDWGEVKLCTGRQTVSQIIPRQHDGYVISY